MNFRHLAIAAFTICALAACGGGGSTPSVNPPSGGGNPPPSPTPTPTSTPTSAPTGVVNPALSTYLPFAQGNTWTFESGGKFVDEGKSTYPPGNGYVCTGSPTCWQILSGDEQLEVFTPSGTDSGAGFLFNQSVAPDNPPETLVVLDAVIATTNGKTTIIPILPNDPNYPVGLPVMDYNPSANEFWNTSGATSTIESINGMLQISSPAGIVDKIASDQISEGGTQFSWNFAQGVGLTGLSEDGASTMLTSFIVNPASAMKTIQSSSRRYSIKIDPTAAARLMKSVIEKRHSAM